MEKQQHNLKEKINMAIGEASMCWKLIPTGVFDSDKAVIISEQLEYFIETLLKEERERIIEEYGTFNNGCGCCSDATLEECLKKEDIKTIN